MKEQVYKMNVIILQPPIVQLNTVYPSGAYLSAFFKQLDCQTEWIDLNIKLFYKIFSKEGLTKLFNLSAEKALKLADEADNKGEHATSYNLRRYINQRDLWINWIDFIVSILAPSNPNIHSKAHSFENAHRFIFGAHVPRGNRMENYLSNLNHDLSTDDARTLASYALADLSDYISTVFDENFSLIRYAERITVSQNSFEKIEKTLDSPILIHFYKPLLDKIFSQKQINNTHTKTLICISIPFAGTFTPALLTGKYLKNKYEDSVFISFGGGFVNTELRNASTLNLSKYCDSLSFDRGYGSYLQLLHSDHIKLPVVSQTNDSFDLLFKLRIFTKSGVISDLESNYQSEVYEKQITKNLIPDYSDIDFSVYPRVIDDTNPMHRLWSDGAWIKAYMAHGCYWHKCAFCDVTLDYVKNYCKTDIKILYQGLLKQCKEKGIFGIHFVDEAMPPMAMVEFARENIAHGSPITWWGNIRFEKTFSRDIADFLAYGGLIGVSAGLESATGNGLTKIHKGTDLDSIVSACCAFKEAGILVHAYMIYGYWNETPLDLINSMETLRQFYDNGLLDSSFWHKFVLTRHSRIYDEWKKGEHPDLKPLEENTKPLFAQNGISFEGEEKFTKYGNSLQYSLNQWMHGQDLKLPVYKWFDFSVPKPTVSINFIQKKIESYESQRNKEFSNPLPQNKKRIFWLGENKISLNKSEKIAWFYMGDYYEAKKNSNETVFRGKGLCVLPDWPIFK